MKMADEKRPKKIVISTLRRLPDEVVIPGDGEKARLAGRGVLELLCKKCNQVWWMRENLATSCPTCQAKMTDGCIESRWTTPQTAFIPQYETKITSNGHGTGKNGN